MIGVSKIGFGVLTEIDPAKRLLRWVLFFPGLRPDKKPDDRHQQRRRRNVTIHFLKLVFLIVLTSIHRKVIAVR